jgi:hypothetical protein
MSAILALAVAYEMSKTAFPISYASARVMHATEITNQQKRIQRREAAREKAKSSSGETFYLGQVSAPTIKPTSARGTYYTGSSTGKSAFNERLDALVDAKANAFVFDAKGSFVYFDSQSPLAQELGLVRPVYDLPKILEEAHKRGMYTIARYISIKDDGLSGRRPDTVLKDPNNGKSLSPGWVDPANATVHEYNGQIICDLAASGVDEINLDYIRMSTAYVGDLRVYNGKEKADRVETFVQMVRRKIDECGHGTKLGISTYAILGWNYDVNVETLGQDVKRFAPYVDIISPMAYQQTFAENAYYIPGKHPRSRPYYLVWRTLKGYADFLGPEHAAKLRPWIQGYYVDAQDVRDEIDAVYDSGACGYQVWNANNNYGPVLVAMKNMPEPPERCK